MTQEEIDRHNDEFLRKYKIPDKLPTKPPTPPKPAPIILKDEERMLRIIYENPLLWVSEIYKKCGYKSVTTVNDIKKGLINKGYLIQSDVRVKNGGRITAFARLTPEACQKLGLKPRPESRAGIKHEIYCRIVKKQLEDQGWTCKFEGQTGNDPHKMDVLAIKDGQRHDYEITVHLKNIQDNINNALGHKLADKVIIVADDKEIEKCRTRTADEQKRYGDALEFQPISEFYIK